MVGDHIVQIAGRETKSLSMAQVRDLIVGPAGTTVTISITRKMHDKNDQEIEQNFVLELTRAENKNQDRLLSSLPRLP